MCLQETRKLQHQDDLLVSAGEYNRVAPMWKVRKEINLKEEVGNAESGVRE